MESIIQLILIIIMGLSSIFVLFSQNPVHSVMFLILTFLSGAGVLIYIGAEFIALIFIIVYVGAIAILFLFIVMMITIKKQINQQIYVIASFFFISIIIALIYVSIKTNSLTTNVFVTNVSIYQWNLLIDNLSNIEIIGQALFNEFLLCFLLCGILLLIALIGAIVLTQDFSSRKLSNTILKQLARTSNPFFNIK